MKLNVLFEERGRGQEPYFGGFAVFSKGGWPSLDLNSHVNKRIEF